MIWLSSTPAATSKLLLRGSGTMTGRLRWVSGERAAW